MSGRLTDMRLATAHDKAAILAEALPYIREFSGRTVVIKYGGHAMDDPALADLFAQDVVLMRLVGMNPVVVHGGGPQISDLMRRLGKEPEFLDGLRVTDAETVDIARMALVGKVNREIVASLNQHGSYAVGLSGEDAGLIQVEPGDERLGFVGEIRHIDPSILERLLREELIPVDRDDRDGRRRARRTTSTPTPSPARSPRRSAPRSSCTSPTSTGVYGDFPDEDSLISRIDAAGLEELVADGKADKGMIPKLRVVRAGAAQRRHPRPHPRRPHPARAAPRVLHPSRASARW